MGSKNWTKKKKASKLFFYHFDASDVKQTKETKAFFFFPFHPILFQGIGNVAKDTKEIGYVESLQANFY